MGLGGNCSAPQSTANDIFVAVPLPLGCRLSAAARHPGNSDGSPRPNSAASSNAPNHADSGLTMDCASLMLRLPRSCPNLQLQPLDAFSFFLTDSEQLAEGD